MAVWGERPHRRFKGLSGQLFKHYEVLTLSGDVHKPGLCGAWPVCQPVQASVSNLPSVSQPVATIFTVAVRVYSAGKPGQLYVLLTCLAFLTAYCSCPTQTSVISRVGMCTQVWPEFGRRNRQSRWELMCSRHLTHCGVAAFVST